MDFFFGIWYGGQTEGVTAVTTLEVHKNLKQEQEYKIVKETQLSPQEETWVIDDKTPKATLTRFVERFRLEELTYISPEGYDWYVNEGRYIGKSSGAGIQLYQFSLEDLVLGDQSILYQLEHALNDFFETEEGFVQSRENTYEDAANNRSIVGFKNQRQGISCIREIVDRGSKFIGYKIYCGCVPDDLSGPVLKVGDTFGSLAVTSFDIKSACYASDYKDIEYKISLVGKEIFRGTMGSYNDIFGRYEFTLASDGEESLPPKPFNTTLFTIDYAPESSVGQTITQIPSGEEILVEIDSLDLISLPTAAMSNLHVTRIIRD